MMDEMEMEELRPVFNMEMLGNCDKIGYLHLSECENQIIGLVIHEQMRESCYSSGIICYYCNPIQRTCLIDRKSRMEHLNGN